MRVAAKRPANDASASEWTHQGGSQAKILGRFIDLVARIVLARTYGMLFLASAAAIGAFMLPFRWSSNEIGYFDLAYRTVSPSSFSESHAIFDSSNSRQIGMTVIGYTIIILGFEWAKVVLAVVCWTLYSLALATVGRALNLSAVELALALLIFVLGGQHLLSGEWMFGTVETKLFGYIFVLLGLAAALRDKWRLMVAAVVISTYLHFLVGGAGFVLLTLLFVMSGGRISATARMSVAYLVLIVPILSVLVSERIGAQVDMSGLDLTLDQIYAEVRTAPLTAPYEFGPWAFARNWMPGLVMHAALSLLLCMSAVGMQGREKTILHWGAVLNGLLIASLALAYVDRETHYFAKFLIFRPSSFVFLVSCILLVRAHFPAFFGRPASVASVVVLGAALLLPTYLIRVGSLLMGPPIESRLEAQMDADERDVVHWIIENTAFDDAVLLQPGLSGVENEGTAYPLGVERLTGRPMIVDFKNVPSDAGDFVRWYRLLLARKAFFDGDCGQLTQLGADYVVFREDNSLTKVSDCMDPMYRNDTFIIARTRPAG